MQFEHFRFLSILGAFAVACGSSAHSATNTNTQPAFNVAGNGSGQQVVYDGGVSALTPEQVTAIESSACAVRGLHDQSQRGRYNAQFRHTTPELPE